MIVKHKRMLFIPPVLGINVADRPAGGCKGQRSIARNQRMHACTHASRARGRHRSRVECNHQPELGCFTLFKVDAQACKTVGSPMPQF